MNILFVCTGNTCRSPMAQAIAEHLLAEAVGLPSRLLPGAGFTVRSAGIHALLGAPISLEAVAALASRGVEAHDHEAKQLDADLLAWADVVYAMGQRHAQAALALDPNARVQPLSPFGDIADPYGLGLAAYEEAAEEITLAIERVLPDWLAAARQSR